MHDDHVAEPPSQDDPAARSDPSAADPSAPDTGAADPGAPEPLSPEIIDSLVDSVLRRSGTGVVLFDHELRFVIANDVAALINGLPAEEHLGHTLAEILPEIAPDFEPLLRSVLESGEPQLDVEVTGVTPALPGERRWWRSNIVRVDHPRGEQQDGPPYVACVFVETTEQDRSRHRLRQLIDNLFTFVGLLDPDGTVREANATALDAAGLELDDVRGRPFWEAYWWSHDDGVQDRIRRAIELGAGEARASRFDTEVRIANGVLLPIDFQLAPIIEDGEVVALVPSGLDIAERVADAELVAALAELSGALNGAVTTADVIETILDRPAALEHATFVNLAVIDEPARCMRIAMRDVPVDLEETWAQVPLEGVPTTPFHDVISTGAPVVVTGRADRERRYAHLVEDSSRLGLEATAALPLRDEHGEVTAVLGLGWPHELHPDRQVEARFELIADLCSQAVARVRRTDAFSGLVESLQHEVLQRDPETAGIDVAVDYRPAVRSLGFGGDWYDTVTGEGGSTTFVVGDVAGHGVAAAAQMAQAKGIVRGLCLSCGLADIPRYASLALSPGAPGFVATLAVATLDALRSTLSFVNAGHPPPVLRTADGVARFLEAPPVGPLGMVREPVSVATCDVDAGSLVVLYSDGLVERRRRSIDDGLDELLSLVAALPAGVDAASARDTLLDAMIEGGSGDDDVAIIVVSLGPAPGAVPPPR